MFCRRCGQSLSETERFCTKCGTPVAFQENPVKPEIVNVPGEEPMPREAFGPQVTKKKKHTLRWVLIAAGCLLAVCAVLVPVLINMNLTDRYDKACDMLDSGDTKAAKAVFTELGGFKDAKDKALECDYTNAKQLMKDGSYDEAITAFAALGDFEDADEKAKECQNTLDYNEAAALKDSGDIEKARDIFLALGSFEDAQAQAEDCQNMIDYNQAVALKEQGSYQDAKNIFDKLGDYSDAAQLSMDCQNNIDYAAADAKYNGGEYYGAYQMFTLLAGFSDAADRANACIQAIPESGELYRNPDFGNKTCALTFKLGDKGRSVYMKIYNENDVLVSTVFVRSGEKTKIKLPTGSYKFKKADGTQWFGETDMFGNDGYYEVLIFDDGSEFWTLSSRYIYTLSFMQDSDGNLGGNEVGPDGF